MAQEIPEYKREEQIQTGQSTPQFGDQIRDVAKQTNSLSAIGARVAQTASTAMATQMGYKMGQDPQGDLLPPITDFDKTLTDSYHTQARATLGLQAQDLLTSSQIEMSKASRLTPDLIANTNRTVGLGLSKIAEQAPTAIKGELQAQFGAQMLNVNASYQTKMIGEQREDQKNTLIASLQENAKTVFNLQAGGNQDAADKLVKQSKAMADNGVNSNLLTKPTAQTAFETIQTSSTNAKYINQALAAKANGNLEEFYRNYATKKPADLTFEQWNTAGNAMTSYMGTLENLKKQDENLELSKFNVQIARNVGDITGDMVTRLKEVVSPIQYEQAELTYIKAKQVKEKNKNNTNDLIAGFTNPDVFSRGTPKTKNEALDTMSTALQQQFAAKGNSITKDEADTYIAATAPGPIPGFIEALNEKLKSTNPELIEKAAVSVAHLSEVKQGQNLEGLTDDARGMMNLYGSLKNSHPATEAAQMAHDSVYNQTIEQKKVLTENWAEQNKLIKQSGESSFYLDLANISSRSNIMNVPGLVEQASTSLEAYYKLTNGDMQTATKMVKEDINNNYGHTSVNGNPDEYTFLPIEKMLDLPDGSTGVLQEDIISQTTKQLETTKDAYTNNKIDYYWELEPRKSLNDTIKDRNDKISRMPSDLSDQSLMKRFAGSRELDSYNAGSPVKISRHWRNGKKETYDLVTQADPWLTKMTGKNKYSGGYDMMLKTEHGYRSLNREDPLLGFVVYKPNADSINEKLSKIHVFKK